MKSKLELISKIEGKGREMKQTCGCRVAVNLLLICGLRHPKIKHVTEGTKEYQISLFWPANSHARLCNGKKIRTCSFRSVSLYCGDYEQ